MNKTGRPLKDEAKFRAALDLAKLGLGQSEIARRINVHRNTVWSWFQKPEFATALLVDSDLLSPDSKFADAQVVVLEAYAKQKLKHQAEQLALQRAQQAERQRFEKALQVIVLLLNNLNHRTEQEFEQLLEIVNK